MTEFSGSPYDLVAAEYYDPKAHPTCHNLNRLSQSWLARTVPEEVDPAASLEVGAGNSVLAGVLHTRGQNLGGLALQDASAAMLAHSNRWRAQGAKTVVADAGAMQRSDASVNLLVASLADPYNTPAFWAEVARVLRTGGQALVTLPSNEWAVRFRGSVNAHAPSSAEFKLRDGTVLELPSFVHPLSVQMSMLEESRLALTQLDSLGVDALPPGDAISPKANVFGRGPSSLLWGIRAVRML